jgi:hypothetical protein
MTGDKTDPAEGNGTETYAQAFDRLRNSYTLDGVDRDGIEVSFEDMLGMANLLTNRFPVQANHYPECLLVQPDMSIALGSDPDALGLGFALGEPSNFPDMLEVTRRRYKGYYPILESEWKLPDLKLHQTALGILPHDDETVTGEEVSYLVVRMTVTNIADGVRPASLRIYVGKMKDSQNVQYDSFKAPISRWQIEPLGIIHEQESLVMDNRTLLVYRTNQPAEITFHNTVRSEKSLALNNCLRFDVEVQPNEAFSVDLIVAGISKLYPISERQKMKEATFDLGLKRVMGESDRTLAQGMKVSLPEQRINEIYKAHILDSLRLITKAPGKPWHVPGQWHKADTWAWEFAHMASPMSTLGYHREMQAALNYFVERQNGVGAHSADYGPVGDFRSIKGTYVGNWKKPWINETGSVLWAIGDNYLYSRDDNYLKATKKSILAAWDWIQSERMSTRILDENGKKVRHFGLMPSGIPHDYGGDDYNFAFNDNFVWFGMSKIAKAFQLAGFPEAERMTQEAEEYRSVILQAIKRSEYIDPDTNLLYVPGVVYKHEEASRLWAAVGTISLFDTGILSPTDKRFEPMVEHIRLKYGILMGMAERGYHSNKEWYNNQTESIYFECYLARDELEKALLVFYSNIAYGMSNDTYMTSERFLWDQPNWIAFMPNASGNGRNLDMIRRMVIDEHDADTGKLWLLRGCPRRWFAKGKSIVIRDARTLFGKMAIQTQSTDDSIKIDVELPTEQPPENTFLVVRHPARKKALRATVNGKMVEIDGETIALPKSKGDLQVICSY